MPRLTLNLIVRDPEIQPRELMDQETILLYADDMMNDRLFPPVIVLFDGDRYWLVDGFHRVQAAEVAELDDIEAEIREGTRDDAIWEAVGANKQHDTAGLRRTNADKRRSVEMALRARPDLSGREIARHVGVGNQMVEHTRQRICVNHTDTRAVTREVNGQAQTYTMQVNGIGRGTVLQDLEMGDEDADELSPADFVETPDREPDIPAETYSLDGTVKPTPSRSKATFNQTNEMVEWAWWTWNPVTGCEHNCVYCYARDIANRFYPEKFTPTFRPERLEAPRNTSYPEKAQTEIGWRNVFVCSMADLFGRWVPDQWIEDVFASCRKSPEWNYLFLTKFPLRYEKLTFPGTAWVGTSVDEQKRVANAEKAFAKVKAPIKWLSVEPLREPLKFKRLDLFDWVVIGGQSRSTQAPEFLPPFEWVADIVTQAKQAGCKVYIKPNIGFDGPTRPREYPGSPEGV